MSEEMRMQKFTTQRKVNGVGTWKGTRYFHFRENRSKEGGNILPSGNQEKGRKSGKDCFDVFQSPLFKYSLQATDFCIILGKLCSS